MSTLIASYSETNATNSGPIYTGVPSIGQCFTSVSAVLDSCKFLLRNNSGVGNSFAKLYAISGTFGVDAIPTGAALATSDPVDVTTIPVGLTLIEFTFTGANRYNLSGGVNYFIVFEFSSGDNTHSPVFAFDDVHLTDPGNLGVNVGGDWLGISTDDAIFYVYGDLVSALQRRTLSALGTRVGTRQLQEV